MKLLEKNKDKLNDEMNKPVGRKEKFKLMTCYNIRKDNYNNEHYTGKSIGVKKKEVPVRNEIINTSLEIKLIVKQKL